MKRRIGPRAVIGPAPVPALAVSVALVVAACGSGPDWFEFTENTRSPVSPVDNPEPPPAGEARDDGTVHGDGRPLESEGGERPGPLGSAVVVRVIDGDSLAVDRDGAELEVRLSGVNAPELYRESADGPDRLTCQGEAARQELADLAAPGASVLLLVDEDQSDRFGRTLADLAVGGEPDQPATRSVVAAMVESGWGFATGDDGGHRALMKQAAEAGRGMWGEQCGQPAVSTIALGRVQADAPGDDRYNLDQEWVEIVNDGPATVDLTGWVLRDDTTGHRFVLDRSLAAGTVLTVVTGRGSGRSGTIHLDQSFPVWSNDRETVVLTDSAGVFVDWRFLDP